MNFYDLCKNKTEGFVIFGGSGFIGSHLVRYLRKIGAKKITVADISDDSQFRYPDVVYRKCDVREKIPADLAHGPAVVVNLAAVHHTPGHEDHEYFDTNVNGAKNVCKLARENDISTIVFTSSIAPYGASEELKYENTLPTPNTPYGISKLIAEYIHIAWQKEDPSRKLIIVRPGVVFGKGEKGNFTRLYQSIKKKIFFYPGRKDTKKAAIYVRDLIRIMTEMVEKESAGIHIYNMCYPVPPTIKEIVDTMCDLTGLKRPKFRISPFLLKTVASALNSYSSLTGKNLLGIHPERIRKLMISTNISGEKLSANGYKLLYSLEDAISDWYSDCDKIGLY